MLIDNAAFLAPTGAFMHPVFQAFLAQTADGHVVSLQALCRSTRERS